MKVNEFFKSLFEDFDANATQSKIVKLIEEKEDTIKRVFNASLPLISMYESGQKITNGLLVAHEFKVLFCKTLSNYQIGDKEALRSNAIDIAILTGTVAISILLPNAYNIASSSYELGANFYNFGIHIRKGEYREAAVEFISAVHTLADVGLMFYGAPEMVVISLLSQAAKEICLSYGEFENDRYLECAANLLYASIRIKAATPHMQTINRNLFGKQMAQSDLEQLFGEIIEIQKEAEFKDKLIDFDLLLTKHNFKNKINDLSLDNQKITNISFKNLKFNNTSFKNASIKSSSFEHVIFDHCDLYKTRLIQSTFTQTHFMNCQLTRAELNWSIFNQSSFTNSDLSAAVFNDTELRSVYFTFCNLFESTFFEAKIADSKIISSNLKDCLMFDTKDKFHIIASTVNEITRPVIGLLYDFEEPKTFAKAMDESLKDFNGIVFRLHYQPKEIDAKALDLEVKLSLNKARGDLRNSELSIPQFIIANAKENSEVSKIKNYVARAAFHFDGLILPGGLDIQPELYGKKTEVVSITDPNYLRSIFEFAMIDKADAMNIPTLGICRGSQIVNVFFGGTLEQNHPEHYNTFHDLKIEVSALRKQTGRVAYNILQGQNIRALSMHHQVSKDIGKGLDVVIKHDGAPELMISRFKKGADYATFVLTQFHPEMYRFESYKKGDLYHNNPNFFNDLMERAKMYNSKKVA